MSRAKKPDPPTWHEPSQKFRKRATVNGKSKAYDYPYPNTKAGAALAAADWQQDLAAIEELEVAQSRRLRAAEMRARVNSTDSEDWRNSVDAYADDIEQGVPDKEANKRAAMRIGARAAVKENRFKDAVDVISVLEPETAEGDKTVTVRTLLEEYLNEQYRRVEHGRKSPNAPRKDRMSPTGLFVLRATPRSLNVSSTCV